MKYYLIEQSGRRWITTDTEQFGGDTGAILIQSSPSIEILSESVLGAYIDLTSMIDKRILLRGKMIERQKSQINDLIDQNKQLSEQLQQKNFA